MPSVHTLISEDGEVPALVEAILGTSDPSVAAALLERACIDVLGSEIADGRSRRPRHAAPQITSQ